MITGTAYTTGKRGGIPERKRPASLQQIMQFVLVWFYQPVVGESLIRSKSLLHPITACCAYDRLALFPKPLSKNIRIHESNTPVFSSSRSSSWLETWSRVVGNDYDFRSPLRPVQALYRDAMMLCVDIAVLPGFYYINTTLIVRETRYLRRVPHSGE